MRHKNNWLMFRTFRKQPGIIYIYVPFGIIFVTNIRWSGCLVISSGIAIEISLRNHITIQKLTFSSLQIFLLRWWRWVVLKPIKNKVWRKTAYSFQPVIYTFPCRNHPLFNSWFILTRIVSEEIHLHAYNLQKVNFILVTFLNVLSLRLSPHVFNCIHLLWCVVFCFPLLLSNLLMIPCFVRRSSEEKITTN